MYQFSNDLTQAKKQFSEYTTQLLDEVNRRRKAKCPLSPTRRKRLALVMVERFMRTFDYKHKPNPYDLERLATAILGGKCEK